MRRTVAFALSALLAVGLCSAGAAAASAVDPVGTITLASGDSPYGAQSGVLGGSAQGVVFADANNSTVHVRRASGQLTTFASAGPGVDVSGDLIVGWDDNTGQINYQSIDGSIQGTATYDVSTQQVVGATATGWVLQNMDADGNATTLVHVVAATQLATTLAVPPNGYDPEVGPAGVAFSVEGAATASAAYTALDSPGTSTVIGSCDVYCHFLDIDGSAVLWQGQDDTVVRQPLDGSPGTRIDPPVFAFSASMTNSHIAIDNCNGPSQAYTVPFSGGAWTKLAGPVADLFSCGIADDGATFLLSTSTQAPAAQAGIYSFPAASAQPTLFVPLGAKPIEGKTIAVGAGRATWVDDARTDKPVWNRSLSGSGNALSAGVASLVSTHATSFGLSVSGRRTVFTHEDGTAALVTGNGAATTIDDKVAWWDARGVVQVSGTRVLAVHDFGPWRVHDLVSGTSTDLVAAVGNAVGAASLWGDTVAYSTLESFPVSSATVAIRNLTTGGTTTIASASPLYDDGNLSPAHPSGLSAMGTVISAWGDNVAWDETTISLVDPTCDPNVTSCDIRGQTVVKYRNFRTMGPVKTLTVDPAAQLSDIAVTSSRVIPITGTFDAAGGGTVLTLMGATLGSATTTQLAQLPSDAAATGQLGRDLSIDGTTVGWLGDDKRPKVLSWETDTARPRFLGNPAAPATFDPATTAWNAEWVFSKPLPTCTVSIRDGATNVRTLGCATTDGSAVVAWDGKDDLGNSVPEGTYTWTVNAADGIGSAVNVDGTGTPISGPVEVTSGPVITVPDAPTGVSATAGNASVGVSWTPPVSTGGSAITGYTATAAPGGQQCTASGNASSCTVIGLTNGTSYTFRVTATNLRGTSSPSTPSTAVTPAAPIPTPPPTTPPPPPAPAGTAITVRASTTSTTWGSPVTLSGALARTNGSPVAGASVAVQSQSPGTTSWQTLSTVATSTAGAWRTTFKPSANRSYRAVYTGSGTTLPTTSHTLALTVRSKITLGLSKAKVRLGAQITFRGVVAPNHKGNRVSLQRLQGNKWVTKKTAKLTSKSTFTIAWKTDSRKDYSWRVLVPKYKDHAAGTSPWRKLAVT